MKDLITAATSGLFVEVGKVIEHMKVQQARIAELETKMQEQDTMLGRRPCINNRCMDMVSAQSRIADLERQLAEASAPAVEQQHIGTVVAMPGSGGGFTMCAFNAVDVPVGTALYNAPIAADTDKVREALSELVEWLEVGDAEASFLDKARAALASTTAAQAPVREVPGWKPIGDSLPSDDCRVLAATWFDMTQVQQVEVVSFRAGSGTFSDCNVTHWQPLPEPPAAPVRQEGDRG